MKFSFKVAAIVIGMGLAAGSWSANAFAQEISESHLSAARDAMTSARTTERFDSILPRIAAEAKAELIRNRPDQEAKLTELVDEVAISLASRRGDLETEVATVFAKAFSEEELTEIAAFYNSETGKKFLKESPIVIREMTNASRVWGGGLKRDMQIAIQEKLTEAGLQ
jgi:hypothetical protein